MAELQSPCEKALAERVVVFGDHVGITTLRQAVTRQVSGVVYEK